ncbi:MAG TPA: ATP-binding protein [Puia sp.]|nr:ATP-binding protein [Puia sp.]
MNLFKEITDTNATIGEDHQVSFQLLPDYAEYLLNYKVGEMASRQYTLSKELKLPVLRYFSHLSEDQLIDLGKEDIRRLLTAMRDKDMVNYIRSSVTAWVNNQIPEFSRNQLLSEDISLLSLIRRKIFGEFSVTYTQRPETLIGMLDETDEFLSFTDRVLFKTLFDIQQELHERSQEIAHLGTWLWDLPTNRITWSKELFRIYELEPTEHVTFDIARYNHPEDKEMVSERMRISRETAQPHDFYYRVILPSGNEKYLHARGDVLLNDAALVERMFGTLQDVTAQHRSEEILESYTRQLEEKNRQLAAKNNELESFAYVASHDLQEPLRKIKLACSRLFSMDPTPEQLVSGLNKIQEFSTKMQALIEGLLNYTRLDDFKATMEMTDLNAVLQEVLSDFSEGLEERQAETTVAPLPVLLAVRLQMQQLFANLVSNSVKYATPGRPLKITVGYSLAIGSGPGNSDRHEITFSDNGLGFSQIHAEKIFELFQRLDNSRNMGTGIGLAICKKIMQNHGGEISVSSEPGAGTTFYIRLPALS